MTTIIVVVVVALVFFVAVCVVSFMVWKRESEMRTDSIKAIEENLEKLTQELSRETHEMGAEGQEIFPEGPDRDLKDIKRDLAYVESVMAEGRRTSREGAGAGILSDGLETRNVRLVAMTGVKTTGQRKQTKHRKSSLEKSRPLWKRHRCPVRKSLKKQDRGETPRR